MPKSVENRKATDFVPVYRMGPPLGPTMPPKRSATSGSSAAGAASPFLNVAILVAAVGYGLWLLVVRGRVSWPPHDFLQSAYTVSGCLALVAPLVLMRHREAEAGLGDLLWLTGGLLTWVFDVAALVRGELRGQSWATPMATTTMGLTIFAVLVAGWRTRPAGRNWSWTNVTGWALGLFWVTLGVATLLPIQTIQAAAR